MILSFKTKINGRTNCFVEKIWQSLVNNRVIGYAEYLKKHYDKFGISWDDAESFLFPNEEITGKAHTIRNDSKGRWVPGKSIHFVVDNRTPKYFQFAPVVKCVSTQEITITRNSDYLEETIVKIEGRKLKQNEVQQLAWNDGFLNLVEFWLFFATEKNNYSFTGKIIHWTNLKY